MKKIIHGKIFCPKCGSTELSDTDGHCFECEIGEPTKKDLLRAIEIQEARRLDELSQEKLICEMIDWFGEDIPMGESRVKIINEYMEDFMRYRQDEGIEELEEVLKRYKKGGKKK